MSDNQSGWQQRIAAKRPWITCAISDRRRCYFCGIYQDSLLAGAAHEDGCLWQNAVDAAQHAKDAIPPSSSESAADDALDDVRHHLREAWGVLLFDPDTMPAEVTKTAVTAAREQVDLALKLLPRLALPPAPEGSPATEAPKPLSLYATCTECGAYVPHHMRRKCKGRHVDPVAEADASPAKETP